jgi:hypothetical protein
MMNLKSSIATLLSQATGPTATDPTHTPNVRGPSGDGKGRRGRNEPANGKPRQLAAKPRAGTRRTFAGVADREPTTFVNGRPISITHCCVETERRRARFKVFAKRKPEGPGFRQAKDPFHADDRSTRADSKRTQRVSSTECKRGGQATQRVNRDRSDPHVKSCGDRAVTTQGQP